ncbi:hypothetical protein ACLQ17_08460 [Streptomyces sp. DT197]|uniref:hypothetical protein n=1 Tax=unclassified Streptomyces TaxID=2593676 RepID=UPI001EE4D6FB|nr:hypothetical protein [Streptomyces sp. T7(2022)]MCG5119914.1 hypothetical protein [Streptomyces sp. T7(2022)]
MSNQSVKDAGPLELDHGFEVLRGDCARMSKDWPVPHGAPRTTVPLSAIHGVRVTPASVRLIDGMSEYGD